MLGWFWMTSGPGWMPWIIIAPIISAISELEGMPIVKKRDKGGLRAGIVGRLRSGDALEFALTKALGMLGDLLFQRVGGKGRGARRRRRAERP